jgi:anti-sigma B factor antagonist
MDPGTDGRRGLSVSSRSERGYVIAALSGELDIACAPALREQLLDLLRPAASRLVIDLSQVSYADASGLAVLVATGRRAGLLGGFLHLATPAPAVPKVRRIPAPPRRLDISPTVRAAITSPAPGQRRPDGRPDAKMDIGAAGTVHTGPARGHTERTWHAADAAELRQAIAAVLMHADAWRDADPCRRFTPALHALARAYATTSQAALTQAAHSLLSILTRQPLTYSPAVAATASRLRRLLDPIAGPPSPEANPHAPPPGAARPHRPAARDHERFSRSLRAATCHCARLRGPVTRDPRAVAARLPPMNLRVSRLADDLSSRCDPPKQQLP